jgi:hypothetical protein
MIFGNAAPINLNTLNSMCPEDTEHVFHDRWFLLGDAVGGDPCGGRAACSGDPCGGRAACGGDPGDAEKIRASESAESFIQALGAIPDSDSSFEELFSARMRTLIAFG